MSLSTSRLLWVSVFAILSHSLSLNGQANVIADPIVLKVSGVRHQIIPAETQQPITFTGLIPGELYQISVPMPEELNTCQPTISKAGSPAGENSALSFMATAEEMTFILHYPCSWNKSEAPGHYISLECRSCTPKEIKPFTGPDEILSVNPLDP